MDTLLLVGAVSIATPVLAGIVVALSAAVETRTPAALENRALSHDR